MITPTETSPPSSSTTQTEAAVASSGPVSSTNPGLTAPSPLSTLSSAVQEGLQQEVKGSPVRTPRPKFSLDKLEKVIAALAKLIEAFAALSRARQAHAETNPTESPPPSGPISTPGEIDTPAPQQSAAQVSVGQPAVELPAPDAESTPIETPAQPEVRLPSADIAIDTRAPIEKGGVLRGRAGFLWKPESDKDGNLAILLPPQLLGRVATVSIISADGKTIVEQGRYAGSGNGGREHFRFSRPGGSFEDGSTVLITMKDGSRKNVKIGETSVRNEK